MIEEYMSAVYYSGNCAFTDDVKFQINVLYSDNCPLEFNNFIAFKDFIDKFVKEIKPAGSKLLAEPISINTPDGGVEYCNIYIHYQNEVYNICVCDQITIVKKENKIQFASHNLVGIVKN
jgi:hypothetical protein